MSLADFLNFVKEKNFSETSDLKGVLKIYQNKSFSLPSETETHSNLWSIFEKIDPEAYQSYKDQESALWVPGEIPFNGDYVQFTKLDENQKTPLVKCLVIFQTLDGAVIDKFVLKQILNAQTLTEKMPYIRQLVAEATHAESYKFQLEAIVPNSVEREKLIRSVDSEAWIQMYSNFVEKYMDDETVGDLIQLLVQAFLEGVGFSAFFAVIFWYKCCPHAHDVPGITSSNDLIAREEGLHRDWAITRVKRLIGEDRENFLKLVKTISDEIIEIISESLPTILPVDLPGLTKKSLLDYAKYTADGIFLDLDLDEYYGLDNPLAYMDTIGGVKKTNFFERATTEYSRGK